MYNHLDNVLLLHYGHSKVNVQTIISVELNLKFPPLSRYQVRDVINLRNTFELQATKIEHKNKIINATKSSIK